jgi:hypothetical protein
MLVTHNCRHALFFQGLGLVFEVLPHRCIRGLRLGR